MTDDDARITLPSPPDPTLLDLMQELKVGFANISLRLGHLDTRIAALNGGVTMALESDKLTREALSRIEASVTELIRVTSGIRHAQDDMRVRLETLEGHPPANGSLPPG